MDLVNLSGVSLEDWISEVEWGDFISKPSVSSHQFIYNNNNKNKYDIPNDDEDNEDFSDFISARSKNQRTTFSSSLINFDLLGTEDCFEPLSRQESHTSNSHSNTISDKYSPLRDLISSSSTDLEPQKSFLLPQEYNCVLESEPSKSLYFPSLQKNKSFEVLLPSHENPLMALSPVSQSSNINSIIIDSSSSNEVIKSIKDLSSKVIDLSDEKSDFLSSLNLKFHPSHFIYSERKQISDLALPMVAKYLKDASITFHLIFNPVDLSQILAHEKTKNYLRNLKEMYRVAQRLLVSSSAFSSSFESNEYERQIDLNWKSVSQAASLILTKENFEVVGQLCCLCFTSLNVFSSSNSSVSESYNNAIISINDRSYHAPCANFWINTISNELPHV